MAELTGDDVGEDLGFAVGVGRESGLWLHNEGNEGKVNLVTFIVLRCPGGDLPLLDPH